MARFKLVFKSHIGEDEASAPLKKEIEDGELGSMKVDPDSVKAPSDEPQNTTKGIYVSFRCKTFQIQESYVHGHTCSYNDAVFSFYHGIYSIFNLRSRSP